MDIRKLDLNLLVVLDAMLQHASVTHAGQSLRLSQPATSAAVARLRTVFKDPLFVKHGARMAPTPRALELAPAVRLIMETLRSEVLSDSSFDPATTERTFTLIMPDIGEIGFLPPLLAHLAKVAPGARIETLALAAEAAVTALEDGRADLAMGYYPDLQRMRLHHQELFRTNYVCVMRSDHPGIGDRMTERQYLSAAHAVVRPNGREHLVETYLRKKGIERHVQLLIPHFMSLVPLLPTCDLISTVPRQIADACVRHAPIKMLKPPIALPRIDVHLVWHDRFHRDAGHVWLRRMLHGLFKDL